MSTGTLAVATRSRRERRACITSDWPKTTASGGISPTDCASELTEFVIVLDIYSPHCCFEEILCTLSTKPQRGITFAYVLRLSLLKAWAYAFQAFPLREGTVIKCRTIMARFRREKHFTREKQLSFAWGSVEPRDLTEVGGTVAPQCYILLHDLHEQSSPSGGGNSCGPAQRRAAARWEFPAKPVR